MTPAQRFKFIRNKWELSESQMAELIGVTKRTIRNYENGSRIPDNKVWMNVLLIHYIMTQVDKTAFEVFTIASQTKEILIAE